MEHVHSGIGEIGLSQVPTQHCQITAIYIKMGMRRTNLQELNIQISHSALRKS